MSVLVQNQSNFPPAQAGEGVWRLTSRVALRLCVAYFGLFCLLTQILGGLIPIPALEIPDLSTVQPFRQIVLWTASVVFRYKQPVIFAGSGSGSRKITVARTLTDFWYSCKSTILL